MKLNAGEDFDYANYLIDNNLLNDRKNMIWFAQYLIREYATENNIGIELNFMTNLEMINELSKNKKLSLKKNFYIQRVLGQHKIDWKFRKPKDKINIFIGDKSKEKNETLPELLFTSFHELGHAVVDKLIRREYTVISMFACFTLYSKKNYELKKDRYIINKTGIDVYHQLHDFWISEVEADIVGGNILLEIINDNFSDKNNFDELKHYIEQRIIRAKLIIYSPTREKLVEQFDYIIRKEPMLSDDEFFLRAEYNEDGSRKNLSQLFQLREQLHTILNNQMFAFYHNPEFGSKRIEIALKNDDELIGELIYKVLEKFTDEELNEQLLNRTEEEIQFILNSVNEKEIELRNVMDEIEPSSNQSKLDIQKHLLGKIGNCSRLKHFAKTNLTTKKNNRKNPRKY